MVIRLYVESYANLGCTTTLQAHSFNCSDAILTFFNEKFALCYNLLDK